MDEYIAAHGYPATWKRTGFIASLQMKPDGAAGAGTGTGAGVSRAPSTAAKGKMEEAKSGEAGSRGEGGGSGGGSGAGGEACYVYYSQGRECEDKFVSRVKLFEY